MGRSPRFIIPNQPVETTTRTIGDRFLLPMTRHFREIANGILARAQEHFPVDIHFFVMLSNHYHLILTPADAEQLAKFMGFVNQNITREANRLTGWSGPIWAHRYHAITISSEPSALEERLRYLVAHGVKEGLVEQVFDWEGPHCAAALATGSSLKGIWYNRTLRSQHKCMKPEDFTTHYTLELAPIPCWKHLAASERRRRVLAIIEDVEEDARRMRETSGRPALGMKAVQRQDPLSRPRCSKRSPIPLIHAASKAARTMFHAAYHAFLTAYRKAADRLRLGDTRAVFPGGCFPPSLPFVRRKLELHPFEGWSFES